MGLGLGLGLASIPTLMQWNLVNGNLQIRKTYLSGKKFAIYGGLFRDSLVINGNRGARKMGEKRLYLLSLLAHHTFVLGLLGCHTLH